MWPLSVSASSPVWESQTLIVRSSLADAMRLPSGLNAKPKTGPTWPFSVRAHHRSVASQTLTVWSSLADAMALAVRAERHAGDRACVALNREHFMPGGCRPTP